mgnify:CR=1 FL=1
MILRNKILFKTCFFIFFIFNSNYVYSFENYNFVNSTLKKKNFIFNNLKVSNDEMLSKKVINFLDNFLIKKNKNNNQEIKSEKIDNEIDELNHLKIENFVQFKKAKIIILDKINNEKTSLIIKNEDKINFKKLNFELIKCFSSLEIDKNESVIFLKIFSQLENRLIFDGWFLSNFYNLTYLDHPRYDLVEASCI